MNRHNISLPDFYAMLRSKKGDPNAQDGMWGWGTSMDEVYSGSTAGTSKHGKNR